MEKSKRDWKQRTPNRRLETSGRREYLCPFGNKSETETPWDRNLLAVRGHRAWPLFPSHRPWHVWGRTGKRKRMWRAGCNTPAQPPLQAPGAAGKAIQWAT